MKIVVDVKMPQPQPKSQRAKKINLYSATKIIIKRRRLVLKRLSTTIADTNNSKPVTDD